MFQQLAERENNSSCGQQCSSIPSPLPPIPSPVSPSYRSSCVAESTITLSIHEFSFGDMAERVCDAHPSFLPARRHTTNFITNTESIFPTNRPTSSVTHFSSMSKKISFTESVNYLAFTSLDILKSSFPPLLPAGLSL